MWERDDMIKLRVQNAKRRDMRRCIVRIDQKSMEQLALQTADIVEIIGKKQSAGIAWPSFPQDKGLDIVRINSRLQKNTDTKADDLLEIRKAKVKIAHSIVLVPIDVILKKSLQIQLGQIIKIKIYNLPVTINDYIYVPTGFSRFMCLKVVSLRPKGICLINRETEPMVINIVKSYTPETHKSS